MDEAIRFCCGSRPAESTTLALKFLICCSRYDMANYLVHPSSSCEEKERKGIADVEVVFVGSSLVLHNLETEIL